MNKNFSSIKVLESFKGLDENWDSYGATPPSESLIKLVKSFIWQADHRELPLFFVAPGPDGEISVEFQKDGKNAEVVFENVEESITIMLSAEKTRFLKKSPATKRRFFRRSKTT